MSKQLTLSAALCVLAMLAVALSGGAEFAGTSLIDLPRPAISAETPGLPGIGDLLPALQ